MAAHVPGEVFAVVETMSRIGVAVGLAARARVERRPCCNVLRVHTFNAPGGGAKAIPIEEIEGDPVCLPIRQIEVKCEGGARVPVCRDALAPACAKRLLQRA